MRMKALFLALTMSGWQQGFAYRILLSPLYFVGAGAVVLAIVRAMVFVDASRMVNTNPVHALRCE